jgi:hypothetical protein
LLEYFFDYDENGISLELFCDLGGLDEVIKRINEEIGFLSASAGKMEDAPNTAAPISKTKGKLVKALLRSVVPLLQGSTTQIVEKGSPTLKHIFDNVNIYGGSIFGEGKLY